MSLGRLRTLFLQHKNPGASVHSHRVARDVRLENGSVVYGQAVLMTGVHLGMNSYVNRRAMVGKHTTIGNYCSIGFGAMIGLYEHPVDRFSTSPFTYPPRLTHRKVQPWDEFARPVTIGHDVWVGANAVVLQGVTLGTGSVVAAGAVVTKDVEPYSVVGGVPARVLRRRHDPSTARRLLESEWWLLPPEELPEHLFDLN